MNTSSPRKEVANAAKFITNKQGKEDQQINREDHVKERGGDRREGGRRGGRGKGQYLFQEHQRRRGGNHSQEVDSGQENTSQENTTTLVVQKNDHIAQSRNDNKQKSKLDNESTSPRQMELPIMPQNRLPGRQQTTSVVQVHNLMQQSIQGDPMSHKTGYGALINVDV